jgi:hypothetical protein
MKITETNNNFNLSKAKKKQNSAADGFSDLMNIGDSEGENSTSASSSVSASGSIFATGSLDALNNLDNPEYIKKQNYDYGKDLLGDMEKMRNQMLVGNISESSLHNIKEKLNNLPLKSEDEKLMEIVEEIRVRAEVELAKIERDKRSEV